MIILTGKNDEIMIISDFERFNLRFGDNYIWITSKFLILSFNIPECS